MFSVGRERVHWERMGQTDLQPQVSFSSAPGLDKFNICVH